MKRGLFFFLLMFFSLGQAYAFELSAVQGTVWVKKTGTAYIEIARSQIPLRVSGDEYIRTAGDGKARLRFVDGTELNIAPRSEVRLGDLPQVSRGNVFTVLYGRVRTLVQSLPRKKPWQIQAAEVALSVRGTEFFVEVDEFSKQVRVCALEGAVEVGSKSQKTLVLPSQGVWVTDSGEISESLALPESQRQWWRQQTLVDQSDSMESVGAAVGNDWKWGGPVAVDRLRAAELWDGGKRLVHQENIWGRALNWDGIEPQRNDVTLRAAIEGTVVPTQRLLFHVKGIGAVKSGHSNPEDAGAELQESFASMQTRTGLSVHLGRQEWEFGDGFLMGKDPWSAVFRKFDGALFSYRSQRAVWKVFSSALDDRTNFYKLEDWVNGFYYSGAASPMDVYFVQNIRNGARDFKTYTAGERLHFEQTTGGGSAAFLEQEFSYQRKYDDGYKNSAYQSRLELGQKFQAGPFAHSLKGIWNRTTSFEPLFQDSHRFWGLLDLFKTSTQQLQRVGASFASRVPVFGRAWTLQLDYSWFHEFRAQADDIFLGREFDILMGLEVHPQVLVQLGVGWFWAGRGLEFRQLMGSGGATQVFVSAQLAL